MELLKFLALAPDFNDPYPLAEASRLVITPTRIRSPLCLPGCCGRADEVAFLDLFVWAEISHLHCGRVELFPEEWIRALEHTQQIAQIPPIVFAIGLSRCQRLKFRVAIPIIETEIRKGYSFARSHLLLHILDELL